MPVGGGATPWFFFIGTPHKLKVAVQMSSQHSNIPIVARDLTNMFAYEKQCRPRSVLLGSYLHKDCPER